MRRRSESVFLAFAALVVACCLAVPFASAADDEVYNDPDEVSTPAPVELDKRSKRDKKHEDEILYGRDETNVTVPADDGKSKPKRGKAGAAPLQGGVKLEELHGNAGDDDGNLQSGIGEEDSGRPLSGQVGDDGAPLQGNAQDDGANLTTDDPDLDDQELQVEWDRWRNNFLFAVQSGVQERLNNSDDMSLRFDPRTNRMLPKFPMGTMAWFDCIITKDRQIRNLQIVKTSGFKGFDRAVLDSVQNLDGTRLLRFPKRSRRPQVRQDAGIKTAAQGGRQYFNFGDVERYRQAP